MVVAVVIKKKCHKDIVPLGPQQDLASKMEDNEFAFMERLKSDKGEEDSFFDDFHSVVEGIKPATATSNDFEDEDVSSGKEDFRPETAFESDGLLGYYKDNYSEKRNKSVDLRGSTPLEDSNDRRYQSDTTLASIGRNSKA